MSWHRGSRQDYASRLRIKCNFQRHVLSDLHPPAEPHHLFLELSKIAPPSRNQVFSKSMCMHGMERTYFIVCTEGGAFQCVYVMEDISYSSCKNIIS